MNDAQHPVTAEERNAQRIAETMREAIRRARAGEPPFTGAGAEIVARRRTADPSLIPNGAVVEMDAGSIGNSRFANRHPFNWENDAFEDFKAAIAADRGNVQPIKVRPAPPGAPAPYEIVYGHRRHRACLVLDLPVRAIVEPLTDLQLVAQMHASNEGGAECTPYEKGLLCLAAIGEGLYKTVDDYANALRLDPSTVYKHIKLSKLPDLVVDAFGSPKRLSVNWGAALHKALAENERRVLNCAQRIVDEGSPTVPKQVFDALCGVEPLPHAAELRHEVVIHKGRRPWASIGIPSPALGEGIRVQFEPGAVDAKALEEALRALAART